MAAGQPKITAKSLLPGVLVAEGAMKSRDAEANGKFGAPIAVDPIDEPGVYVVIDDATVKAAVSVSSNHVNTVRAGTEVKVLEVVTLQQEQRIRAKIASPEGWISLFNTQNGHRWAIRKEVELCRPPTFESVPLTGDALLPEFRQGAHVDVWSNSKERWCPGVVLEINATEISELGQVVPVGSHKVMYSGNVEKWIKPEQVHEHLRPTHGEMSGL
jgi:hypothetical protein